MCLRIGHQHSQFWPILARFMDNYSLFWGPGVISTIDEPRGAFTCRSSTLTVLVDSDPFRGLLLIVLGSQNDFHGCRTPRCAYVLVVKTRSLGRFSPVSWTITQFCGPEVISTIDEPGVPLRVVINTHYLGQFLSVSWTISPHFGVPERFPRLTILRVRLGVRCQHS